MKKALSLEGFALPCFVAFSPGPSSPQPQRAALAPPSPAQDRDLAPAAIHTSGTAVIRSSRSAASSGSACRLSAPAPRASQAENVAIVKRVLQAIRDQGSSRRTSARTPSRCGPESRLSGPG